MSSGNCFCFFSFFDAIRKDPGGLFFISVGQLQQRPIDERKVGFKKGRENQNILSSFLLQIKKEKLIEEKLKSLLGGWKDANSSVFTHTLLLGGQRDALEQTTEPTAHPADLGSNAGSTVASVCAAFNSSRQQLLIKLDECLSLCFSILKFR